VSGRYLIINADDGGLAPEADEGILDTIRAGAVTSVSLLVNTPFRAPVKAYAQFGVSMGLHLNLTLGRPCSPAPSPALVDRDGRFRADGHLNPLAFDGDAVTREFLGQLERFRNLVGADPTHLDVHKHLHRVGPAVLSAILEMAAGLDVPVRCLDETMRTACRAAGVRATDQFLGAVTPAPYWTLQRLRTELAGVSSRITEIMCHPGKGLTPMKGVTYITERDEERRTFSSSAAKEFLAPFTLVGFRDAPLK